MKNIKCISCHFARQDKKASEYTHKHCSRCKKWANCEVCRGCKKYDTCKARLKQKANQGCDRRFDTICCEQELKWAAIQCTNPDSEYHRALLNVTPAGAKEFCVTWNGCVDGERRCDYDR